MIELRWKTRWIQGPLGGRGERVLQYRQWKVRIDASGAITPLPAPIEWTDWQDTPEQFAAEQSPSTKEQP